MTIVTSRVLDLQDSIYSYRQILDDIRTDLGMDTPEFKQQFSQDHVLPHGYLERRHQYLWLLNVRREYAEYLRALMKKQGRPAIGIPIFIDDPANDTDGNTSFRLKHVSIGSEKFDRDHYFDKEQHQGKEIVYLHAHSKSGYQFWIVAWDTRQDNLVLTISTWIIDHDTAQERNTLYLARTYTFSEVPDYDITYDPEFKNVPPLVRYSASLTKVSDVTRRLAFTTAKEVTRHNSDDWVLVAAPYGITETMSRVRYMLEQFDVTGILETMKDRYFKVQWFRLMAKLFWSDNDVDAYLRTADRLGEHGILKHDWFRPITTHPRDAEQYDEHRQRFEEVRKPYNIWANRFWQALNGVDVDLSEEVEFPEYPLHEPSPDSE